MEKILITGSNGLLGSELLPQLCENYEVHAIVRTLKTYTHPNLYYHQFDLEHDWQIDNLPRNLDIIIHLAQSEHFREFPDKAEKIFSVNISTPLKLLDTGYKLGVKKIILASSGGVYGHSSVPISENEAINVNPQLGYYLGSKLCAEVLAQNYSSLMDVLVLRFFFMYGKFQKRTMLIPRLVDNIRYGIPIQLQGDGLKINPVHVSDAALAVIASLTLKGSHTINIAGNEVMNLKEISETIAIKLKKEPNFVISPGEPKHLVGSNALMKNLLHDPKILLSKGIEELLFPD